MKIKKLIKMIGLLTLCGALTPAVTAQQTDGFGQIIEINTRLHSYLGKPTWLLIVRDVDHGQNIPYMYDIRRGTNHWLAFTYSRNYLITTSELVFHPYKKKIKNFCGLESMGRIQRGTSYNITITGSLTGNPRAFECNILKYKDPNFTIAVQK